MSIWIPPCKHFCVCLCLCVYVCICVCVRMCIICAYAYFCWFTDRIDNNICSALHEAIYIQKPFWNILIIFFISVLFSFWLLFSLKGGSPFLFISLPSVLLAIWMINYSELGYWKCWIWDRQRHCYCHDSQVKSPMIGKIEASHLFWKNKKEDDGHIGHLASLLCPVRSWNRSLWKLCQYIWKTRRWLERASMASPWANHASLI